MSSNSKVVFSKQFRIHAHVHMRMHTQTIFYDIFIVFLPILVFELETNMLHTIGFKVFVTLSLTLSCSVYTLDTRHLAQRNRAQYTPKQPHSHTSTSPTYFSIFYTLLVILSKIVFYEMNENGDGMARKTKLRSGLLMTFNKVIGIIYTCVYTFALATSRSQISPMNHLVHHIAVVAPYTVYISQRIQTVLLYVSNWEVCAAL